jgi:hypothetical protein
MLAWEYYDHHQRIVEWALIRLKCIPLGSFAFLQPDYLGYFTLKLLFFGSSFLKMAVVKTADCSNHPSQCFVLKDLKTKLA